MEVEAWPAPMGQPPVFFKEFSQAKGITGAELAKAIVTAAAAAGGNHTDHTTGRQQDVCEILPKAMLQKHKQAGKRASASFQQE